MSLVDDETKAVATDEVIEDAMNKPIDEEVVGDDEYMENELVDSAENSDQEDSVADDDAEDVIDIKLTTPTVEKKKFRLNGDNSKIIELNIHDTGIVGRLSRVYKNLKALDTKVSALNADLPEDADSDEVAVFIDNVSKQLSELDDEMRKQIDMLFNSNISDIVAPKGEACMYDPVGGMFRYEHIIETLSQLYANNLNREFANLRARTSKHTNKYTKKKKH